MTATNHTLTGAVTATFIANPFVAIPVAFLLHFVLDSLPHYGASYLPPDRQRIFMTSSSFKFILAFDSVLALSFLLSVAVIQPQSWPLIIACGIACASPDLMWLPRWLNDLKDKTNKPLGKVASFHSRIQWGERPWGWIIEAAWFVTFLSVYLARTAP